MARSTDRDNKMGKRKGTECMNKTAKILSVIAMLLFVNSVLNMFGIGVISRLPNEVTVLHAILWQVQVVVFPLIVCAMCAFVAATVYGVRKGGANALYIGVIIAVAVLLATGFIAYVYLEEVPSYQTIFDCKINSGRVIDISRRFFFMFEIATAITLAFVVLMPERSLRNWFLITLKYVCLAILVCSLFRIDLVRVCLGDITDANIVKARFLSVCFLVPYYVFIASFCVLAFIRREQSENSCYICSFDGRLPRCKFWPFYVLIMLMMGAVGSVWQFAMNSVPLYWFSVVFGVLITIPIRVRRLHDRNASGWWILLFDNWVTVTIVAMACYCFGVGENVMPGLLVASWVLCPACKIVEFVLLCLKGTDGDNKYGPDPLKK